MRDACLRSSTVTSCAPRSACTLRSASRNPHTRRRFSPMRASRTSSELTTGCGSTTRRGACRRWLAYSSALDSRSLSSPRHTRTSRGTSAAHERCPVMFARALATEFLKLRRSKVTWFTFAALSIGPLAIALMMWIVREPGRAAQLGLLGTKANLSGLTATWPAYFSMLTLMVGIGGMLLLSFIVAYIFGREYAEGTAKNLLALPVGRHWFVLAKLVVAAVWWAVLVVAVLAEALVLGAALALPGFSAT